MTFFNEKIFVYLSHQKDVILLYIKVILLNFFHMKHTEIPHQIDALRNDHSLEHGDKLIYASIRRYMNADTRECFPAIGTIASKLKCSTRKVMDAIKRLVSVGLIEKSSSGKKNCYKFPKSEFDKQFEMFTDAFLDMDLPLNVKEYYMDIQQYLYGKDTGVGKCSLSNAELARRTGWTSISIKKYNTILIERGLLEEESSCANTDEAGFPLIIKSFDLQGLNQAHLWAKKVTAAVMKHEQEIQEIKEQATKQQAIYESEINNLKKEITKIQKELALARNKTSEPINVEF